MVSGRPSELVHRFSASVILFGSLLDFRASSFMSVVVGVIGSFLDGNDGVLTVLA